MYRPETKGWYLERSGVFIPRIQKCAKTGAVALATCGIRSGDLGIEGRTATLPDMLTTPRQQRCEKLHARDAASFSVPLPAVRFASFVVTPATLTRAMEGHPMMPIALAMHLMLLTQSPLLLLVLVLAIVVMSMSVTVAVVLLAMIVVVVQHGGRHNCH